MYNQIIGYTKLTKRTTSDWGKLNLADTTGIHGFVKLNKSFPKSEVLAFFPIDTSDGINKKISFSVLLFFLHSRVLEL